jgi:hypothetical protein
MGNLILGCILYLKYKVGKIQNELANHYHLTNGLAEFWNVRSVRMLSKNGLVITQINNNLDFQNLSDNRRFFYANVKNKTPYHYQFIIVDNLPRNKIIRLASPDHIYLVVCTCLFLMQSILKCLKLSKS